MFETSEKGGKDLGLDNERERKQVAPVALEEIVNLRNTQHYSHGEVPY